MKNISIKRLTKTEKLLFEKPFVKVPLFMVSFFLLGMISSFQIPEGSRASLYLGSSIGFATSLYLIFFVIYLMRRSLKSLFTSRNLIGLFISYVLFVATLTLLFSMAYGAIEDFGKGYLTYGDCTEEFSPAMIDSDEQISHEYYYFSAVTFFTIGYGDICPMGWSKYLAIFNGFIGNFIMVVIMVIVISSYINRASRK